MKTTLIATLISLVLFSSCSKDNDAPGSMAITCTIDGTNVTFNTMATAIRTDVAGAYSVQIIGYKSAAGSSDQIAIGMTNNAPIATGTYDETGSANGAASVNLIEAGNPFPYISYISPGNPVTVTITAISSSSIQGTFKGDIFLTSGSGITSTKKVVTNGQFNVSF